MACYAARDPAGLSLEPFSLAWILVSRCGLISENRRWHWLLVSTSTVALVGSVWGSLIGSLLPFLLRRLGFDPATSSAPLVATLVDVTGLVIYFTVALVILRGTLL